jgi:hypothetical protein
VREQVQWTLSLVRGLKFWHIFQIVTRDEL